MTPRDTARQLRADPTPETICTAAGDLPLVLFRALRSLLVSLLMAAPLLACAEAMRPPATLTLGEPSIRVTFIVYFDWDRADLSDRARLILTEAAVHARRTGSTRIEVEGHADRSGTPQYNQRLSQRRAEAVVAELMRQGIPRDDLVIRAFGESSPLLATPDGVPEPQNRRVQIVHR
ncbi:OmpA family protein [Roseomonas sp. BN140053]|uniref:OmpA family protein n=1 Tax=Roseomonas sp. BN140053 TaxID=3391898 RepID=UPI0039E9CA3A